MDAAPRPSGGSLVFDYGEAFTVQPFGNGLVVMTLTGGGWHGSEGNSLSTQGRRENSMSWTCQLSQ